MSTKINPFFPSWFPGDAWIKVGLLLSVVWTLFATYHKGVELREDHQVTERARYHAIPVALAQIYYHHKHDYTGLEGISFTFQGPGDLQALINEYRHADRHPEVDLSKTYYWVADDRGLCDYVNIAFRIFGPYVQSMYKLFFVILGISSFLLIVSRWRDLNALLALNLVLLGLYGALPYLRLANATPFSGYDVSLQESRVFDLLALPAVLHLLWAIIYPMPVRFLTCLGFLLQAAIFSFLLQCRSSLQWEIVTLAAVGLSIWLSRWLINRSSRLGGYFPRGVTQWLNNYKISQGAIPLVCLFFMLLNLATYERIMYNPSYFHELGSRTFWHNALMGMSYADQNQLITKKYKLEGVNDAAVTRAVFAYRQLIEGKIPENWTTEVAMDSVGSHFITKEPFNWIEYELWAKRLYFSIWREQPGYCLRNYLLVKPSIFLNLILDTSNYNDGDEQTLIYRVTDKLCIDIIPMVSVGFTFLVIILLIGSADNNIWWKAILPLFILTLFSTVPGMMFYPVHLTTMVYAVLVIAMLIGITILILTGIARVILAGLNPNWGLLLRVLVLWSVAYFGIYTAHAYCYPKLDSSIIQSGLLKIWTRCDQAENRIKTSTHQKLLQGDSATTSASISSQVKFLPREALARIDNRMIIDAVTELDQSFHNKDIHKILESTDPRFRMVRWLPVPGLGFIDVRVTSSRLSQYLEKLFSLTSDIRVDRSNFKVITDADYNKSLVYVTTKESFNVLGVSQKLESHQVGSFVLLAGDSKPKLVILTEDHKRPFMDSGKSYYSQRAALYQTMQDFDRALAVGDIRKIESLVGDNFKMERQLPIPGVGKQNIKISRKRLDDYLHKLFAVANGVTVLRDDVQMVFNADGSEAIVMAKVREKYDLHGISFSAASSQIALFDLTDKSGFPKLEILGEID